MALALASGTPAALRGPLSVRASVSSGSRAPANISVASPTQLLSRLDALRQKAKSGDLPQAFASSSTTEGSEEVHFSTHFSDQRVRLQHWWKEHLEDKAALVQAATTDYSDVEEEATVILSPPVEIDWVRDRYPARPAYSRV